MDLRHVTDTHESHGLGVSPGSSISEARSAGSADPEQRQPQTDRGQCRVRGRARRAAASARDARISSRKREARGTSRPGRRRARPRPACASGPRGSGRCRRRYSSGVAPPSPARPRRGSPRARRRSAARPRSALAERAAASASRAGQGRSARRRASAAGCRGGRRRPPRYCRAERRGPGSARSRAPSSRQAVGGARMRSSMTPILAAGPAAVPSCGVSAQAGRRFRRPAAAGRPQRHNPPNSAERRAEPGATAALTIR